MAKSKTTSKKKTTGAKKTASKAKTSRSSAAQSAPPSPAPQPIRRELGALVFLCLTVFTIIGLFNSDGKLIVWVTGFVKGLVGWGFYLCIPVFFLVSLILFFHHGRPVELRVFAALMLPLLFAAMAELALGSPVIENFDMMLDSGEFFASGQQLASCAGFRRSLRHSGHSNTSE